MALTREKLENRLRQAQEAGNQRGVENIQRSITRFEERQQPKQTMIGEGFRSGQSVQRTERGFEVESETRRGDRTSSQMEIFQERPTGVQLMEARRRSDPGVRTIQAETIEAVPTDQLNLSRLIDERFGGQIQLAESDLTRRQELLTRAQQEEEKRIEEARAQGLDERFQKERARLSRANVSEAREFGLQQALAGTARGTRAAERQQILQETQAARNEALRREAENRRQLQIAQIEGESRARIADLQQRFDLSLEQRLGLEEQINKFAFEALEGEANRKAELDKLILQEQLKRAPTREEIRQDAAYGATNLISFDPSGEIVMPSADDINAIAQQTGVNPNYLIAQVNQKAAELQDMSFERRVREIDIMQKYEDLKNTGLTGEAGEYTKAIQLGYINPESTSLFDYIAQKKQASQSMPSSYQEWILAGGDTGTGKTYAEFLGGNQGLSPDVVAQVDRISSSFDSAPITKQFNEVQNKKISFDAIIEGGLGGPGDLAIVYEFMKALDPTSVVRESEFDSAAQSGNIFAGVFTRFNKGYFSPEGGILPDEVKASFSDIVDTKYDAVKSQYNNLRSEKARLINQKTGSANGEDYLINYNFDFSAPQRPPTIGESLIDIGQKNPQLGQSIADMMADDIPDEVIGQILEAQGYSLGLGFNGVGGDTYQASPITELGGVEVYEAPSGFASSPTTQNKSMVDITKKFLDDVKQFADNCVFFARKFVPNIPRGALNVSGRKEGLRKAEEQGYGSTNIAGVKPGFAIHTNEGDVGHTAIVVAVEGDDLVLTEANYKTGKITTGRRIKKTDPKILGWIAPEKQVTDTFKPKKKIITNTNEGKNKAIEYQIEQAIKRSKIQRVS